MRKVVVTGASGFIGRHLVPHLAGAGYEVIALSSASGDVAEPATWKELPAADAVVHLAARSFVPESWEEPGAFLRTNLGGTVEALEYCRRQRSRLVFLSSYLYGDASTLPIAETSPLVAKNPYALSKKLAEEACQFFAEHCRVDLTMLRPFNIYGPGQSEMFLVPAILKQLTDRQEVRVRDLAPRRDYVYVLDVVDAIVRAVTHEGGCGVLNIGSGVSHSVAQLIETMQQVWGTDLPVRSDGVRRKGEIMDTVADVSRAEAILGWRPRYTLRQGLEALNAAP